MNIVILEPLAVSDEIMDRQIQFLEDSNHTVLFYKNRTDSVEELIKRCKDAEIVILTNINFPEEVMIHCPNLKLISVAFTGVDHIDLEYCRKNKISVCNAAGYSTFSVAELTIGLMINLLRKISINDTRVRSQGTRKGLIGNELYGKAVGIIGTGAIGSQVARILLAFGCNVIAFNRTESDTLKNLGVQYLSLQDVLQKSDIVSLHLPLTKDTTLILDRAELELLKPNCILINCARGPLINYTVLSELLNNQKIAGAGIDVFEVEPPLAIDHPLIISPNTLLTPHIGFATNGAFQNRLEIVFENIKKWIAGKPQNTVI